MNRAVPVMGVGPPGSPCRRRAQTAAMSCRSRAGGGSDCGKGLRSAGQVSDEKTNGSEPLLTHRKPSRWHRNRGWSQAPGQRLAAAGCVPSARGRPACCPGGARCKGGVSSSQALARNRRTCRLDAAGQGVVAWPRKGEPRAAETASGGVPMRGTGAGRPIVAMKGL